ncbi:MAG: hypothetical protein ABIJ18_04805 [archaeon]
MTKHLEQAYKVFLDAHAPQNGQFTQDTFREGIARAIETLLVVEPLAISQEIPLPYQVRLAPIKLVSRIGNNLEGYFSQKLGKRAEIIHNKWSQNQY